MRAKNRFLRAFAWVYILRCADGTLYTGWTNNLTRRFAAHAAGKGAKYTRARRPVMLAGFIILPDAALARSLEARFKALTRPAKLAAMAGSKVLGRRFYKPPSFSHFDFEGTPMPTLQAPTEQELTERAQEARTHHVVIETSKGDIAVKLFPDDAPIHTAAFLNLVHQGFYDGLTFHRVEPGFVIQGGCPDGDGTGGPGYRLPAEFNSRKHLLGTLAMARSSDPNSAGSQFYICLDATPFLDGQYTVFGETILGKELLNTIKRGEVMKSVKVVPDAS